MTSRSAIFASVASFVTNGGRPCSARDVATVARSSAPRLIRHPARLAPAGPQTGQAPAYEEAHQLGAQSAWRSSGSASGWTSRVLMANEDEAWLNVTRGIRKVITKADR